jgi:hypothetical protein
MMSAISMHASADEGDGMNDKVMNGGASDADADVNMERGE